MTHKLTYGEYTSKVRKEIFEALFYRFLQLIEREYHLDRYSGLKIGIIHFKKSYIKSNNCELIVYAVMRLLIKYARSTKSEFGKFTITYIMRKGNMNVTFTIGKSVLFRDNWKEIPVFDEVDQLVRQKAEVYEDEVLSGIKINIYLSEIKDNANSNLNDDEIARKIKECMNREGVAEKREARTIGHSKRRYLKYITELKPSDCNKQSFIVADTETILIDDKQVPYAVGLLVVNPNIELSSYTVYDIEKYYSEDYPDIVFKTFEERKDKMLYDFFERLVVLSQNQSINTVYFHNLSKFDGIMLLKHISNRHEYNFKPLIRNLTLYEIAIYRGKKLLLRLRDSLHLLPGSLEGLAKTLCPELGVKGKISIQYDELKVKDLLTLRDELLNYMMQDILLLGGVMKKAQEIYWKEYNVDIVKKITISSLAFTIFRTHFYNQNEWPIYIPNRNEDTFIRRGYYGGHADTYIPYGENLYYYDVNSLYPFIMKTFPMPGGKPIWHGKLAYQDLDNMYGFFEAYVITPPNIKRPFLPHRDDKNTLIFPTGKFVGVYYSEELKYARTLGYKIIPLSGYLYQNVNSTPFGTFISSLFEKRKEAKKIGAKSLDYMHKITMNSLYGRFGINPKSTKTEICDEQRYNYLIKTKDFTIAEKLNDKKYIINYWTNTEDLSDTDWSPPRISAIQLSAAITAGARIYMYPYISRDDCYYTDTDSVVLGNPLPEGMISSSELGKFKLEHNVKKGIFLAPKSYCIKTQDGDKVIIKHKGLAKALVDEKWFEAQYADITKITQQEVTTNFKIDWKRLEILRKKNTS